MAASVAVRECARAAIGACFTAALFACAQTNEPAPSPTAHRPCSYGNAFVPDWQKCGAFFHNGIVPLMLGGAHLYLHTRNGIPYDAVNPETKTHYFVEMPHAKLFTRAGGPALFLLPLRDRTGRIYTLKWLINGEFDRYLGSSPPLR